MSGILKDQGDLCAAVNAKRLIGIRESLVVKQMMSDKNNLEVLQDIEAGISSILPDGFVIFTDVRDGWINTSGDAERERLFNQLFGQCVVCNITSPLIWHHVNTKTSLGLESTRGMSASSDIQELLGVVRVCPNCHYLIHQLNPHKKNGKPVISNFISAIRALYGH